MENVDNSSAAVNVSNHTDNSTCAHSSERTTNAAANLPTSSSPGPYISSTTCTPAPSVDLKNVDADSPIAPASRYPNSIAVEPTTENQLSSSESETDSAAFGTDGVDVLESGVNFMSKGYPSTINDSSTQPFTEMVNSSLLHPVYPASLPPFSQAPPTLATTYSSEPAVPSLLLHPQGPYIPPNPSPNTLSPAHIIRTPLAPSMILPASHSTASVPSTLTEDQTVVAADAQTTESTTVTTAELIQTNSNNLTGNLPVSSVDGRFAGSNGSGEYYVMVHVDAGEMFSVRVGDQIQHIPGPATVRMVSNSGPPLPMPMRVPPGHLVQQIVDEEGILTHVILSLYPGPGQPPPSQTSATTLNPGNQTNGLVNAGTGLVLDPTQHLHLHHGHPHHHPTGPSSVSTVGGNHLGLGVGGPVAPLPTFHPHQTLPPPPPNGPTGAPPGHFHSQFLPHHPQLPHQHFHPYPFHHPPHPSVCSTGLKQQQQQPVMTTHACPNESIPHYNTVPEWSSNGQPEPDTMASLTTAENDGPSQVASEFENHCVDAEQTMPPEHSTTVPEVDPPQESVDAASEETVPNVEEKSRGTEENKNPVMETSTTCPQIEQHNNHSSTYSSPNTAGSYSQQSSPNKTSGFARSQSQKLVTNGTTSTPLSEVNFNGSTSEQPHHPHIQQHQHPSIQSVAFGTNDSSGPYSPVQLATQRRRRTAAGKNNASTRPPSRLGVSSSSKSFNSTSVTDSVTTANHHSTTTTSVTSTKKPTNTSSRAPNSVGSTPTANLVTGNTASTQGDLDTLRVSSHTKPPNTNLAASPTYSHGGRGRGRSQQPYLLSTPPSHLQSNGLDYTPMPYSQPNEYTKGIPSPSDVILRDRTHQMWESEIEREAIQSVLSAIPPPQVSDVEAYSALIHLSLPSDLTIPLSFGENGEILTGGNLHAPPPVRSEVPADANNHSAKINKSRTAGQESKTTPNVSQSGETSWALDEGEIQFELHLAERDIDSRFNCVFLGEATYISLQDLRPGSDYYVKACCVYADIRGQFSTIARFTTQPAEPTAPRNVTVIGHTRTSLHVKWSAAADNGSRITGYRLEYARANNGTPWSAQGRDGLHNDNTNIPHFIEGFYGLGKACKLTQLTPSTEYLLRVMAENNYGSSPWSSIITASTSGSPPPTPHIPHLVTNGVHSLTLAWPPTSDGSRSVNNHNSPGAAGTNVSTGGSTVSYMLEMDDEAMGHGFVTVFDGTGTEHCVENLRRNTRYRFRLAAANLDGRSRWSDVVTFSTLPDQPSAPRNLRLSSSLHPTRISLVWDTPEDDGGVSIQAYRLEIRLPYIPRADGTSESSSDVGKLSHTTSIGYSDKVDKLLCWPHVSGLSGKTTFCSVPPSIVQAEGKPHPVMPRLIAKNQNSARFTSHGPTKNQGQLYRPAFPSDVMDEAGALLLSNSLGSDELSKLGYFTESDSCQIGWFAVYEGNGQEVLLDGLLPGTHLLIRVRARSATMDSNCVDWNSDGLWGSASTPPLQLVLPAVVPEAPASRPRVVGRPRSHSVCLTWQPPRTSGGAPIVAYEVWQMSSNNHDSQSDESEIDDERNLHRFDSPAAAEELVDSLQDVNHPSPSFGSSESVIDTNSKQSEVNTTAAESGTVGRLVCSVPTAECRLTGLRPGHTYAFRVRARNRIGRGPWTSWASVTTMPSPPAAPARAPRVHPQTESSRILVSWDAVQRGNGAPVSGYLLEWKPISGSATTNPEDVDRGLCEFQLLYSGLALSYELDDAQPASRFAFRVCAVNSAGPGPWSPIGTCFTLPTVPGQPCGLRATNLKTDAVQLHWFMPQSNGSPITSFTLELTRAQKDSTSPPAVQLFDVPSPSLSSVVQSATPLDHPEERATQQIDYTLTELIPACSYKVRIRALNSLGYGTFSSPLAFATLPPRPVAPEFTGFTHLTASSVRVQWCLSEQPQSSPRHTTQSIEADDGQTTSPWQSNRSKYLRYTLQLSRDSDPEWMVIYEGSETLHKATRLQENTTYSFRVCASNESGPGAYSAVRSITTLRLPPPSVRGLKAIDVSVDACQLEWTPVIQNGYTDPLVYVLHLMPVQSHPGSTLDTIPSQVYRGCQTSCRVTDLLPNTEYVCRVCAIRLCQPKPSSVPLTPIDGSQVDENCLTESWQREFVASPKFQICELAGPFSHSLVFTTRAHRDAKSSQGSDVSASHLRGHLTNNKISIDSTSYWRWLQFLLRSPLSWFGTGRSELGLTADERQSANSNINGQTLTGRVPFGIGPNSTAGVSMLSNSIGSSPWRRRIAPAGATALQQSPKPAQSTSPGAQHHHHHSGPRRGHSWFRLSDRKLACLLLCLFALATLLVALGLQHFLTAHPNQSPPVTVEQVHTSSERVYFNRNNQPNSV